MSSPDWLQPYLAGGKTKEAQSEENFQKALHQDHLQHLNTAYGPSPIQFGDAWPCELDPTHGYSVTPLIDPQTGKARMFCAKGCDGQRLAAEVKSRAKQVQRQEDEEHAEQRRQKLPSERADNSTGSTGPVEPTLWDENGEPTR